MRETELLKIEDLGISFPYGTDYIQVVRGVNIKFNSGEIIGILGESGSGKTVTATSVLRLTEEDGGRIDSGRIIFKGKDLLSSSKKEIRNIRGREISYIFQNSTESLNPYRKVGKQIEEVQKIHGIKTSKKAVIEVLKDVGLENAEVIYDMYPLQLSGGQCQRAAIAMSVICKSSLIIADEPTSSIDASMRGLILDLLKDINKKYNISIMIITHDFEVVKYLCNRIVVMYGGLIMEQGGTEVIMNDPKHPYTKELIECVKSIDNGKERLYTLDGKTPGPMELKNECPFISRCKVKSDECANRIPEIKAYDKERYARCINA